MSLLEIQNLNVRFGGGDAIPVVEGLDLTIDQGEVLAIVGESGSGKSVTMMSVMGLIEAPGEVTANRLNFAGQDLLKLKGRARRQLIGKDLSMVFQDPMTALNPSYTVGYQIEEVIHQHLGLRGREARQRALQLLERVEIPGAASRLSAYPHQLSGGMSQRVAIAMAIAAEPKLLIADEPTTALDVTIQAQIMDLLLNLQRDEGMALILITHDLAVVAETAQRVCVMYAGQAVETGVVPDIFQAPKHPYTEALLAAIPEHSLGERLSTLPGIVPGRYDRPKGCLLSPRCPYAQPRCLERPALEPYTHNGISGSVRCFFPRNLNPEQWPEVLPESQRPSHLPGEAHGRA
jgi:dipeptide transport system ATP-binding protein